MVRTENVENIKVKMTKYIEFYKSVWSNGKNRWRKGKKSNFRVY